MPNVFQQLNDKYLEENPLQEAGIENKVMRQADNFYTWGRVVELFVPNALNAAIEMIGGGGKAEEQRDSAIKRPDLTTDWRKPIEVPQAPRDGILGRFRPTEGRGLD